MELAFNKSEKDIFQKDISLNQEISYKYLDQIITGLKSAGLVANVSGKKSGYRLTREPERITAYDIHSAFNSRLSVVDCLLPQSTCSREGKCAVRNLWQGLNMVITDYLKSITINDLVRDQFELDTKQEELIFHI